MIHKALAAALFGNNFRFGHRHVTSWQSSQHNGALPVCLQKMSLPIHNTLRDQVQLVIGTTANLFAQVHQQTLRSIPFVMRRLGPFLSGGFPKLIGPPSSVREGSMSGACGSRRHDALHNEPVRDMSTGTVLRRRCIAAAQDTGKW